MTSFLVELWMSLRSASLADQASAATVISLLVTVVALGLAILGLLVPLVAICFSAWRYLSDRRETSAREQFHLYHRIIAEISRGADDRGIAHKLVNQLAYIHELRNFPEYGALTCDLLTRLKLEWQSNEPIDRKKTDVLAAAIEGTIAHLQGRKNKWRR